VHRVAVLGVSTQQILLKEVDELGFSEHRQVMNGCRRFKREDGILKNRGRSSHAQLVALERPELLPQVGG
jgi:hypothetical protein